jgi:hypothetical protein
MCQIFRNGYIAQGPKFALVGYKCVLTIAAWFSTRHTITAASLHRKTFAAVKKPNTLVRSKSVSSPAEWT